MVFLLTVDVVHFINPSEINSTFKTKVWSIGRAHAIVLKTETKIWLV